MGVDFGFCSEGIMCFGGEVRVFGVVLGLRGGGLTCRGVWGFILNVRILVSDVLLF